jgi:phospholipid transport system substrate-binding protein
MRALALPTLLAALSLLGAADANGPMATTKEVLEQTRVIIDSDRTHNGKLAALSTLLNDFLDTDTMGKTAMGPHFAELTPAEQKEFLHLFRELFQRTYVQKLLLFERPDFGFVAEQIRDGEATVGTKIITKKDEFAVGYQMRKERARWMATDIQVEDLSLTQNFRRQFDRLLKKEGKEQLLDRMRKKYGTGDEGTL